MKIGRRGVLGMIAAAPVAGPAMADVAAKQYAGSAARSSGVGALGAYGSKGLSGGMHLLEPDEAIRKAFNLGLVSRETVERLLVESGYGELSLGPCALDPDLQVAKSFSLTARMRMQRDRQRIRSTDRFLGPPKGMWEFGRDLIAKGIIPAEKDTGPPWLEPAGKGRHHP